MSLFSLSTRSAAQRNLARLCLLRGLLIAGVLMAAAVAEWLHEVPLLHDGGVLLALALLTGFNVATMLRLRRDSGVGEGELFAQLVVDVLLMTLVLYRTGGATNPFISWYLVPLTIAAATLRLGFTVALALLTLSAYSLLLFRYVPFAPFTGMSHGIMLMADDPAMQGHMMHMMPAPDSGGGFNVHVFGMWLNFLLSAGLITFFVTRMSSALREQDKRLAEQHERLLQREQVVALGALAAGAAHELGTPLSTMTVIARDMEAALADSPLREDMAILRRQLALCRDILNGLRDQASGDAPPLPLSRLMRGTVERMEIMYPARVFSLAFSLSDRHVQPPATLQQVLVSLLDNAAQAARSRVGITVGEDGRDCVIDIDDDGPGIAPEIAAQLGAPFVSDKSEGLGLGYFLSHASVNQLGGSIHLQQRPDGGTHTCLRVPMAVLRPGERA